MLIKFIEIDWSEPLQPIYVDARYSRLFILVRWKYRPLGLLQLPCPPTSRTFTVERLQQEILERFGWDLWERAVAGTLDIKTHSDDALPPISVIVCTRDRPLSLERCLRALAHLDYPTYEVVVVDNCSTDTRVAEVITQSGFRYVREDRPGLDWARNCGVQEARYEIVAYIDDDALASPGWLRGVAYGFENPEVMAVTGIVLPAELETQAQNDFERYGGMNKGFSGYTVDRDELDHQALLWASNWGIGANMAFRRRLFKAIGDFDVALDVGTPTNGGGDIEFFYRTVAAGHLLRYEPAAMVRHVHRRDDASLQQQIYNNGRSFAAYLLTIARNEPDRRMAVAWFGLRWWLWNWLLKRLLVSLIKHDGKTFRLALMELRGCRSALGAYRAAQKVASRQRAQPTYDPA